MDYTDWKISKEIINYYGNDSRKIILANQAQEEYQRVVDWCRENSEYTIEDDGTYYKVVAIPEPTPPTDEEIRQMREKAYEAEVDPITAHIQRLRDMEQTEEVKAEIAELIAERDTKVAEIKERYPYNEE